MSFGLILSGGAAYGIANAGVVKVFEEKHVQPDVIAGSSMGAIIGALSALGHDAKTICDLASALSPLSLVRFADSPLKKGFHGGILTQQLKKHLGPLIGDATIGETKIPFMCVAGRIKKPIAWSQSLSKGFLGTVLDSVEPYVFPPETRIIDAIAASSALPVIFSPVEVARVQYVDLCSFGAVPSRLLKKFMPLDAIIATNTSPTIGRFASYLPSGLREFAQGSEKSLHESLEVCDIVITPEFRGYPYEFHKGLEFIAAGEEATRKKWSDVEQYLN